MNFLCGSFFPAVLCAAVLTTASTVARAQQPIELEYQHNNAWLSPADPGAVVELDDTLKLRIRGLEQM
ncbi:MAG: hypothetical protein KDC95_23390, partial [Planctomycetes bacterium]|nr:hypothetical protein [Planctomycetota bacterium]